MMKLLLLLVAAACAQRPAWKGGQSSGSNNGWQCEKIDKYTQMKGGFPVNECTAVSTGFPAYISATLTSNAKPTDAECAELCCSLNLDDLQGFFVSAATNKCFCFAESRDESDCLVFEHMWKSCNVAGAGPIVTIRAASSNNEDQTLYLNAPPT